MNICPKCHNKTHEPVCEFCGRRKGESIVDRFPVMPVSWRCVCGKGQSENEDS